jgi:hypothetical protein
MSVENSSTASHIVVAEGYKTIQPPLEWIKEVKKRCSEFAKQCAPTVFSHYQYRNNAQTMALTMEQLEYSKMAEFYAMWYLVNVCHCECTEPDTTIYQANQKHFDHDLYCWKGARLPENKVAVHVKSCPSSYQIPSWNGQWGGDSGKGRDKDLFESQGQLIMLLQYHPEYYPVVRLYGIIETQVATEFELWQLPRKSGLADNKRFIYNQHSSGHDLVHLPPEKRQFLLSVSSSSSLENSDSESPPTKKIRII